MLSEHLLFSKSRALEGLLGRPFLTIKTRSGTKRAGLGPQVPAPAHPQPHIHPSQPPGRKRIRLNLDLSSRGSFGLKGPPPRTAFAPSPPGLS